MDPITIAGTGLAILGSKDLLNKVLGPTADYLGSETRNLVEKCNINLDHVFQRAKSKLGDRLGGPGAVSPRVLKHVIDEGRFAEEEIVVEYYGGLLAGSKSLTGKDDRALPYLSKVQQMSAYQLRLHFIFYFELLRIFKDSPFNLGEGATWPGHTLLIPHEIFLGGLPAEDWVTQNYWKIMAQAVVGLSQEGLISNYTYGNLDKKAESYEGAPTNAILLSPSFLGAELFMWAMGSEAPSGHEFFNLDPNCIEKAVPMNGAVFKSRNVAG